MKKTFIQKVCGAKVFALMFTTLACVVITACSSDDEEDSAASEIVGTWIMDDDVSITFNANNTGYITALADDEDYTFAKSLTRAAQTQTISFTYNYDASARKLTMTAYGETETWTDVSITDGVLYATDSDGDRITAVKQGSDTVVVTGDIDISKLYGTWINGNTTLTFTENTIHHVEYDGDETISETYTYSYDETSHTLTILGEGTLTITALTDSRLSLKGYTIDGVPNQTITCARKGIEVGDKSLLYGKTWKLSADEMWLTFKSDGTGTISFYDEEDGKESFSTTWDYDSKTKTITIYVQGTKVMSLILTGLTSDVFLCILSDDESDESTNVVFYAD